MASLRGAPVEHVLRTPCDSWTIMRQISLALSRGLREATDLKARGDHLTILASGPSLRDAPWDALHRHRRPTVAVNGALAECVRQGYQPSYWVACDPQALVADFLDLGPALPWSTTYLVASKCHPSVLNALARAGRQARLWHVDDFPIRPDRQAIPVACSVTATAFELFRAIGYRRFETWGWDGCYLGGEDHAGSSADRTDRIDVRVGVTKVGPFYLGGRTFHSSNTWAAEGRDALLVATAGDFDIDVRGPGMFGAMLRNAGLAVGGRKTKMAKARAALRQSAAASSRLQAASASSAVG